MTVSNTTTKNKLSTNGVTVDFPFTFYLTNTNQVFCKLVDPVTGVETDYTNFTVVKAGDDNGGTVTTLDVLDNTDLLIFRDTPLTQETDYVKGGRFPADSHEAALDKLTLQNQEQEEEISRAIKVSIGADTTPTYEEVDDRITTAQETGDNAQASADAAQASADNAQATANVALNTANSIGGSPINGGVWAAGIEFNAYNEYMIFNGVAYKPIQTTSFPYTSTATPDPLFVAPFELADAGTFNTVAEMVLAETIQAGDLLETKVNNTTSNAGGAKYLVKTQAQAIADGDPFSPTSTGNILTSGGLVAVLLISGDHVEASQVGVTTATDSTAMLQECASLAEAAGVNVILYTGKPELSSTLLLKAGMYLIGTGRGCELIPTASGIFTEGWMVLINSTDGINATIEFPNLFAGGCQNFSFNNASKTAGRRGVKGFGGCWFQDINSSYMEKTICRPSGEYMDMLYINRVFCEPVLGNEYQVDLEGLGDAVILKQIHCPWNALNPSNGTPKSISVGNSFGGTITACIGGDVRVVNSKITISDSHFERGEILLDTANVTLSNTYIAAKDRIPVIATNNGIHESTLTLDSVEFAYVSGLFEWTGAHVQIDASCSLSVRDSYQRYTASDDIEISQMSAIRVQNDSAVEFSAWKNYAYQLSKSGVVGRDFKVMTDFEVSPGGNSFTGISSIGTAPTESWGGASGTYHYNTQIILDEGRLLGRSSLNGEASVALVNGGNGAQLIIAYGDRGANGILKVYRGTSPNSYTEEVLMPLVNARIFYDSGLRLNGYDWVSRGAGGVNGLNAIGEESFKLSGTKAKVRASAPPTLGAWPVGDRVDRVSTAAGSNIGWTNTTTGFKAWGNIDA